MYVRVAFGIQIPRYHELVTKLEEKKVSWIVSACTLTVVVNNALVLSALKHTEVYLSMILSRLPTHLW